MQPATVVQFNALHIDKIPFIRHYNLPEHLLDYNDIDNILRVLGSVICYNNTESRCELLLEVLLEIKLQFHTKTCFFENEQVLFF